MNSPLCRSVFLSVCRQSPVHRLVTHCSTSLSSPPLPSPSYPQTRLLWRPLGGVVLSHRWAGFSLTPSPTRVDGRRLRLVVMIAPEEDEVVAAGYLSLGCSGWRAGTERCLPFRRISALCGARSMRRFSATEFRISCLRLLTFPLR